MTTGILNISIDLCDPPPAATETEAASTPATNAEQSHPHAPASRLDWTHYNRRGMHFVALAEAIIGWTPDQIRALADRIREAPDQKAPNMEGMIVPPVFDSWDRGQAMNELRDELVIGHREVGRWASYVRAVGVNAIAGQ